MRGTVILVTGDLMFWAEVRAAAERVGTPVARVDSDGALEEAVARGPVSRALFDLGFGEVDADAWARRLKARPEPPVLVGFGSHVDEARLRRAAEAGFDVVMPRSRFVRSLSELLAGG